MKKRQKEGKKAQAMGELLMRIGGLILIISLLVLVLIKFGVIKFDANDYKKYLLKNCIVKNGLDCIDDTIITSDSVTIILNNEGDESYNLNNFDVVVTYPLNATCTNPKIDGNPVTFPVTIESETTTKLNYSCLGLQKGYFEANTNITLMKVDSITLTEYKGKIIGELK